MPSKWEPNPFIGTLHPPLVSLGNRDTVLRHLRMGFRNIPTDQWTALQDTYTRGLTEVEDVLPFL